MEMKSGYNIKPIKKDQLPVVLDWAAEQGWKPNALDVSTYYNADPEGFLIGELDGVPIGCISAVRFTNDFGFIAFYITCREFRGQGYGIKLWHAAMDYLGRRSVGLDSVLEQRHNYEKAGLKAANRILRFAGKGIPSFTPSCRLVNIKDRDFAELAGYERKIFPGSRSEFLQGLIGMPDSFGLAAINKNQVIGLGLMRFCGDGFKIGPLFADNIDAAGEVMHGLACHSGGNVYFLDAPQDNNQAVLLAKRHELYQVSEVIRMYSGKPPEINMSKVFGIGLAAAT